MLTDKIRVEQSTSSADSPEDIFSESLPLFPDETRNHHGDPDAVVVYSSTPFGDVRLRVAEPAGEQERMLFAHYVWNASVLLAEMISGLYEEYGGVRRSWDVEDERVLELGAGI